jgi:hypothetical protein
MKSNSPRKGLARPRRSLRLPGSDHGRYGIQTVGVHITPVPAICSSVESVHGQALIRFELATFANTGRRPRPEGTVPWLPATLADANT